MTVATKDRAPKAVKPKAEAMKLTVERDALFRALTHAAAIVERRNTIPVLANVLLDADGDGLKITATDLDLQISLTVPATVESGGSTTVQAHLAQGIVREMSPGCQVDVALAERLVVRGGRGRYTLQTVPADQFPVLQIGNAASTFVLPAPDLLRSLKRVEFAQSSEVNTRMYLCGVNIETADGELVFAATDGNTLAFASLASPEGAELAGAILPAKLVATLVKLLDGVEGDVRLFFEERKATFEIGSTVVTSKLIDGSFPDWRRVLPAPGGKPLLVAAETLESAIRRVTVVANERLRAVKIELSRDKLTASCTSSEHGHAVEEAPCVWDSGELVVGFDGRRLLDAIRASEADELQINLIDAKSPSLISNPADDSAKWIVMPMRV